MSAGDENGTTPLHVASANNDLEVIKVSGVQNFACSEIRFLLELIWSWLLDFGA